MRQMTDQEQTTLLMAVRELQGTSRDLEGAADLLSPSSSSKDSLTEFAVKARSAAEWVEGLARAGRWITEDETSCFCVNCGQRTDPYGGHVSSGSLACNMERLWH